MKTSSTLCVLVVWATVSFSAFEVWGTEFWYEDNHAGRAATLPSDWTALWDQPDTWVDARSKMDVYLVRANSLRLNPTVVTDQMLTKMIRVLADSGVKLSLDVQGAKRSRSEPDVMNKEIQLIQRIIRLGGVVDLVAPQSVLSKPLPDRSPYEMVDRIADVTHYCKQISKHFPRIKFGLIDALPSKVEPAVWRNAYSGLQASMAAEGLKVHVILVDQPFENPEFGKNHLISWETLKDVQDFIRGLDIKHGFWFTSKEGGNTSPELFEERVLKIPSRLAYSQSDPDVALLGAWHPYPKRATPDDSMGSPTMTRVFKGMVNEYQANPTASLTQAIGPVYVLENKVFPGKYLKSIDGDTDFRLASLGTKCWFRKVDLNDGVFFLESHAYPTQRLKKTISKAGLDMEAGKWANWKFKLSSASDGWYYLEAADESGERLKAVTVTTFKWDANGTSDRFRWKLVQPSSEIR